MGTQEKRRQRFEEKVFAQRFLSSICRVNEGQFGLQSVDCPTKADFVAKDAEGNYLEQSLNPAWWAWNAALDSIVIELPEVSRQVTFDDESIDVMWPDEVREAVQSAGLKVKP